MSSNRYAVAKQDERSVESDKESCCPLNRFISKATNKCLPFFDSLKGNKRFLWDEKCEQVARRSKNTYANHHYSQNLLMATLLGGLRILDLRGSHTRRKKSPVANILHQQMVDRCGDEIPRDGETGLNPNDRFKKTEAILSVIYDLSSHQLLVEASPLEIGCFRSPIEVVNRIESIRYRVPIST